jgi:hypothetical protein
MGFPAAHLVPPGSALSGYHPAPYMGGQPIPPPPFFGAMPVITGGPMPSPGLGCHYGSVDSMQPQFPWPSPPPPGTAASALSAPANLNPVRSSGTKHGNKRPPSTTSPANALVPGRSDGSMPQRADAAQVYAAQEMERQRQHLQQMELRQQQQLQRIGAHGSAYDRLAAQGMPLP